MTQIHKPNKNTLLSLMAAFPFVMLIVITAPSYAGEKVVDILPPTTHASGNPDETIEEATHPIVRLTPDKSELIHLDLDASSIIIGNPTHINVIADSSRTLVIVPRMPGATHFTVLSTKGQVIMQRHVIVASPKKDYVRIKRVCPDDSENCQNTSVFYCPDMCHEIGLGEQDGKSSQSDTSAEDGGKSASDADSGGDVEEGE